MERRAGWIALGLILLTTSVHAVADTHVGDPSVVQRTIRLDRPYDETLTWHATVQVAAVGAKLWPRLTAASGPAGGQPDVVVPAPTLHARFLVDGEPRWEGSWESDSAATWSGALEVGECRPRGTCAAPPIVAGLDAREVTFEVRILHDGPTRAGAYAFTLGPLDVESDRGPWIG